MAFDQSHQWPSARRLLGEAASDAERAIALGFCSHLLVDIIAHNHFVPAHEKLWLDLPLVTHALSKWAMDAHLGDRMPAAPSDLLCAQAPVLAEFGVAHFGCSPGQARRALNLLARADGALRRARIPDACYHGAKVADPGIGERFEYYVEETGIRLAQINRILDGEEPSLQAKPPAREEARRWTGSLRRYQIRHRVPLPRDLFKTTA